MLLDFLFTRPPVFSQRSEPRIFPATELKSRDITSLDQICALGPYRELRNTIHAFKYRRMLPVGRRLGQMLSEAHELDPAGVLCPVPLHFSRRFYRGFNQARILAQELSKRSSLPVESLLRRTRPTGHQTGRKKEKRWGAMRGAFRARRPIDFPVVYLIDDVFTTGATLEECARVLREAGARSVEGIVLAYD